MMDIPSGSLLKPEQLCLVDRIYPSLSSQVPEGGMMRVRDRFRTSHGRYDDFAIKLALSSGPIRFSYKRAGQASG